MLALWGCRRAKEHEGVIVEKEREASKLQKYLEDDKRKIGPLEQELQNVHRWEPVVMHALPSVKVDKLLGGP